MSVWCTAIILKLKLERFSSIWVTSARLTGLIHGHGYEYILKPEADYCFLERSVYHIWFACISDTVEGNKEPIRFHG